MQNLTYDPSDNPQIDAERNFYRAERIYLRKKAAPARVNPLKGEKPSGSIGVATSQKSVVKEPAVPKLDAFAQAYVNSVRARDGEEKANKLVKETFSGKDI